jgi:6-phosphogluconate dehydrogenase (decarboxylating)
MQLGIIGLGRMRANMVRRLIRGGHQCVVYDRSPAAVEALVTENAVGSVSLDDFVSRAPVPVLSAALYQRFSSRGEADFADQLLSAMRFEFGGHREIKPSSEATMVGKH